MRTFGLFMLGLIAGGTIAVQGALNAALGKRVGELGSVVIVAVTSAVLVLPLLALMPGAANLRNLPGPSQWYLYLGGVLGIVIVTTPIILVPRVGATATITALIVGQLALAVLIDHFGLLGVPRSTLSLTRLLGVGVLALGAVLILRR